MNFFESVRIALGMLALHKLRAFLTMLGVIIGVMSVTMIVMLSEGFKAYVAQQFSTLSPDSIFLFYDNMRAMRGRRAIKFEGVSEDDRRYIAERVTSIRTVSGVYEGAQQTVKANDRESKSTRVTGIDADHNEMVKKELIEGRLLNKSDVDTLANSTVITDSLRDQLFPDGKALGKTITMPGLTLEVVGVIKHQENGLNMGGNTPRAMEIPVSTAMRKWAGGRTYAYLMLRPKEGVPVTQAMDDVWRALMARTNNVPLYRIDSNESILAVFEGVIGVAGVILAAVAALSLLVGGIGIMNIMLVSVTERTREIGLRKAVGGRSAAILTQFLVEAAILSLIGGLIGMGIAFGMGQLIAIATVAMQKPTAAGISAPFPITAALGASVFSAAIGLVFGFFPAVSASRLDPIVALRHE